MKNSNPSIEAAMSMIQNVMVTESIDLMSDLIKSFIERKTLSESNLTILNAIVRIQSIEDKQTGAIFKPADFMLHDQELIQAVTLKYLDGSDAFTIAFQSELLNRAALSLIVGEAVDQTFIDLIPAIVMVGLQNQLKMDPEFKDSSIPMKIVNVHDSLGEYNFVMFDKCEALLAAYKAGVASSYIQSSETLQ